MLRKDTTGAYLYGGPGLPTPSTIWGLKPVKHTSFTSGTPLVADFKQYEVPIRAGIAVSMSDQEGTNFRTDSVTYKARLRAAAGTDRPYSFCTVSPHV